MRNRSLGWGYEKTGFCYFLTSVGVTVSGLSGNVNLLAMSVMDGLAAPKPPSQFAISCSGRVSISGSI